MVVSQQEVTLITQLLRVATWYQVFMVHEKSVMGFEVDSIEYFPSEELATEYAEKGPWGMYPLLSKMQVEMRTSTSLIGNYYKIEPCLILLSFGSDFGREITISEEEVKFREVI